MSAGRGRPCHDAATRSSRHADVSRLVGARSGHDGNVIDMWTPLRRALSIATAAAVAVLLLVCVSLVHHEDGAPTAAPGSQPGVVANQPGSTSPEPTSGDHCAMSELVACVQVAASPAVALALLALTTLALALANAGVVRPVRRTWVGAIGTDPPTLLAGPSLTALCISRT